MAKAKEDKTTADKAEKKVSSKKAAEKTVKSDEKSPEEVLKAKKEETKAAKKAGPKAERSKKEAGEPEKDEAKSKPDKPRKSVKPARPRIERRGKQYKEAFKHIEKGKEYDLNEAVELLPKTSFVKFTPSVEIHINLGVDPKQADEMVRGTVVLPHGTGKSQRVAVVAGSADQKAAKAAGADLVGDDDLLEKISKGQFDFDILIATPALMPKLGQHAKALGPKGLMPNPKSGTVTGDVAKIVKELKGGRVEFRIDAAGIIHQAVGKLDLKPEQLTENINAFIGAVQQAKPAALKGIYIKKTTLSTSMGPGLKLNAQSALS